MLLHNYLSISNFDRYVPRGTIMKNIVMRLLFFIQFALFATGCNKPIPNPEMSDPIYLDIQARIAAATTNVADFEVLLKEKAVDIQIATPQTSQLKWAHKRYYATEAVLAKAKQDLMYWKIKSATRQQEARRKYLKFFYAQKQWPDQEEFVEWNTLNKVNRKPAVWSYERRMKELHLKIDKKPAPKKITEAPSTAKMVGAENKSGGH